jgi:hypothetical protein
MANISWGEVNELEERLAAYVGVRHAIACSSGTDALLMALLAYQIGPGDAIFTTPFTFIATAEVIQLLGATPVFVDIDPRTFNLDPAALEEAVASLGKNPRIAHLKPKGVIPVDFSASGGLRRDQHGVARFIRPGRCGPVFRRHLSKANDGPWPVAATSFSTKPLEAMAMGAIFTDSDS